MTKKMRTTKDNDGFDPAFYHRWESGARRKKHNLNYLWKILGNEAKFGHPVSREMHETVI